MSVPEKRLPLQERIRPYFTLVDAVEKRYKCEIEDCNQKYLSGVKQSNLVSHVKKQHANFFRTTFAEDCIVPMNKYSLPYRRLRYIQKCAEIVAINSNPFSILNQSGICGLLEDELAVLRACGYAEGLHPPHYHAVKRHIAHLRNEIQNDIKCEVQDKAVAVMVDTATNYDKSILGVTVQYMVEGEQKIRTIAMKDMTVAQTAQNLKMEIEERMETFGVRNVVSFTTDNASTMIAMVRLMNDCREWK